MEGNPFVLLFLSVDVIGSTSYKNQTRHSPSAQQPWLGFFIDFYQEFPALFADFCRTAGAPAAPQIWKAVGDELVFTARLECHHHAHRYITAFKKTLKHYTVATGEKPLRFKACAWTAGFPVINAVVNIGTGGRAVEDYIGPHIDTGFRLAQFADARKLIVSVELALLLAQSAQDRDWDDDDLRFYYDGARELKGVLGGDGYPIMWIDRGSASRTPNHQEPEFLCYRGEARRAELRQFCADYIARHNPALVIPYFDSDCPAFSRIPPEHQVIIAEHRAEQRTQPAMEQLAAGAGSSNADAPCLESPAFALSEPQFDAACEADASEGDLPGVPAAHSRLTSGP